MAEFYKYLKGEIYEISDSFNKEIHYSILDIAAVIDGSPYSLLLYNS